MSPGHRGLDVIPVTSLSEAAGFLTGQLEIDPTVIDRAKLFATAAKCDIDFADVRGKEAVKRALTIAAATRFVVARPAAG